MSIEDRKRQYRWQCRRGASEVEVVLYAYLDNHFDQESPENQDRFEALLACQDADMFEWFTHRSEPQDPELRDYVRHVLAAVSARKG
ncbi:MAG: succinate dehydrogenase assembly factor 2 [Alcanivorax sp.]|nr:succinate dehydrogenase assembly factor 2 [Alcanivorax sp.]